MKKTKEAIKDKFKFYTSIYWPVLICFAISIILLVISFLLPPPGQIDNSVLTAVGEIFGFATLFVFIERAHKGADITFRHKDTEVVVNNPDNSDDE